MPDSMHGETVALPLPLPEVAARAIRIPRRVIKLGFAGSILFAGVYGIVSENKYVSTSNAVVTTYVLAVRTPIDGTVTGLPIAAGVFVHQGELLAQLDNPRVDRQHLDNLQITEDMAQSTADALAVEQDKLNRQRAALVNRSDAHMAAVHDRLKLALAENERLLEASKLALQEATIELNRGRQLHDAGILASADYDKLVTAQHIADQEYAAQQANLASVRTQEKAAARGILTEPGQNNDVSYSRQRADEITIKLAENTRILLASRAQASESQSAVDAESARSGLMRHSELESPIDGLLWRLNAVNGEHAAAGNPILSLIDCRRQFLLAEVPQDRVPDVALNHTARFRLAGESTERTGDVLSVMGDSPNDPESKLAVIPARDDTQQLATVLIRIDANSAHPDAEGCLVGRTARVLIPTVPTNRASRWFRKYF